MSSTKMNVKAHVLNDKLPIVNFFVIITCTSSISGLLLCLSSDLFFMPNNLQDFLYSFSIFLLFFGISSVLYFFCSLFFLFFRNFLYKRKPNFYYYYFFFIFNIYVLLFIIFPPYQLLDYFEYDYLLRVLIHSLIITIIIFFYDVKNKPFYIMFNKK